MADRKEDLNAAEPSDGSLYEGERKNGQPHGQGILSWSEGRKRYEGSR